MAITTHIYSQECVFTADMAEGRTNSTENCMRCQTWAEKCVPNPGHHLGVELATR